MPGLQAYTPGIQPAEKGWVKLNTNECPYPPSPRVAAALRREIGEDGASLRLYPNPASAPLRQALAAAHRVGARQVFVGNGSDEILDLLVRCCCGPAAPAGFSMPSYSLYPVLVGIQDGAAVAVAFDRGMKLPVEKIAASGARIFFLTSPNAPTGVGFTRAELARILDAFPGLLVVDEAYAPFAREDAIPLLGRYRRLIVLRTFSKAHALAGIRIGYALADPEVIGWLDRVRGSYNVSRLSQAAALAALSDPRWYAEIRRKVVATRDRCIGTWRETRGWFVYPSEANFIFAEPRDAGGRTGPAVAASAYEFLLSRKVLVRHFPSHALTAPFLRVSVGTDDEMAILEASLEAWLKTAPTA